MIFDKIENINRYEKSIPYYEEIIEIINQNIESKSIGEYKVNDELRYIISQYESIRDKPFEVHKNEIDLQIILNGNEKMEIGNPVEIIQKYDKIGDCALAIGVPIASVNARVNDFVLFSIGEYHKPGIMIEEKQTIKKIIFKIKSGI